MKVLCVGRPKASAPAAAPEVETTPEPPIVRTVVYLQQFVLWAQESGQGNAHLHQPNLGNAAAVQVDIVFSATAHNP